MSLFSSTRAKVYLITLMTESMHITKRMYGHCKTGDHGVNSLSQVQCVPLYSLLLAEGHGSNSSLSQQRGNRIKEIATEYHANKANCNEGDEQFWLNNT